MAGFKTYFRYNVLEKRFLLEIVFLFAAWMVSYHFTLLRVTTNVLIDTADLKDLMMGNADTPFQYRILIPYLVRYCMNFILLITQINSHIILYQTFEFFSCFFLIIVFRNYLQLFNDNKVLNSIYSIILFNLLSFNYLLSKPTSLFFCWDIPSILFFTMGLIFLFHKKWWLYYFIFVIATFNRETTYLITLVFLLTNRREMHWKYLFCHILSQFIILASIKFMLYMLFIDNAGSGLTELHHSGTTITHLSRNLIVLINPKNLPYLFSNFGFIWILVLFRYQFIENKFIKASLGVIVPQMVILLIYANIYELRVFGELYPLIGSAFVAVFNPMLTNKQNQVK